jgi:hypothetical protein
VKFFRAALLALQCSPASAEQTLQPPAHPELLMVVNGASPVSVAIGSYYRNARNVPAANVVTLEIPLADATLGNAAQETIPSKAVFDSQIRVPLEQFLQQHGLVDSIEVIVLASGIAHRYAPLDCALDGAFLRDCPRASVDAELAVLFSSLVGAGGIGAHGETVNPYFDSSVPFAARRAGHPRNRADRRDPHAAQGRRAGNNMLLRPIESLLRGRGVSVLHDQSDRFVASPVPLLGYASWGSNDSHSGRAPFYGQVRGKPLPGRSALRGVAVDLVSTNGRTFVTPVPVQDQSLSADLVHLGACGVTANAFEPPLIGLARTPILFRNYFEGSTAIESFYRSVS